MDAPAERNAWGKGKMLGLVLNKSRRQHPTRQQVYGNVTPILQTIPSKTSKTCWAILEEKA